MKFDILNRWTRAVQFTAEIECEETASVAIKVGLSVVWARMSGADLRGAVLTGAVLTGAVLSGADLRGADLTGADLTGAVLTGAVLRDADLTGAVLSGADLRGAVLTGADLSGADLTGADLRGAVLTGADLSGADLTGADLRGAVLTGADLRGAVPTGADLRGAVLRGADLTGAVLSGVPRIENIHQKVFEAASASGALHMGSWHACETTHCRAGWVVTLAGEAGLALEYGMGTAAAAALIYLKSDPTLEKIPDFYCDNETALADMKACAEREMSKTTV